MDPVLEAFLASADEASAEERLGEVLARHAAPFIRRVVSSRLGSASSDIEDVCSQLMLTLMVRLRQLRADANLAGIGAFAGYVASATHHACDHYVRAKHPLRWRLRNRIRYVLEHDARFAVWKAVDGCWLCGRAEWRAQPASQVPLSNEPLSGIHKQDVKELLSRLFRRRDSPLELSAVVEAAAAAWDVPLVQQDDDHDLDVMPDREPRSDASSNSVPNSSVSGCRFASFRSASVTRCC